ncbi:hypothetical protein C453_09323 [Haloferax elongans ATCC BAA-1513]|uniref:Uncharacterized protein n=1 Tax=Haloferax elongans ATCC BAA-1513 TaxID=1230453 RepID=M0HNF0_HALEO|nr:hypothetical protein [Haloferax elongans]ELZ86006.1 hypothetical protein C453_09323 [Haloferax elongans ATCC BAA-1513]
MSRRHSHDTRTDSDYQPTRHRPAPSFTVQAIMLALTVGVVVVASYPVLSLVAMTAAVGLVALGRVVTRRAERDSVNVHVPGLPVQVTVASTARD